MGQVNEATLKLSNVNNALADANKALGASAKECKRSKNQLEDANRKFASNQILLDEKNKECENLKNKIEDGQNKLNKSNLSVEVSRTEFLEQCNKLNDKSRCDAEKIEMLTTALDTAKKECDLMKLEIKEANTKLEEEKRSKKDHNIEKEATKQDKEEIFATINPILQIYIPSVRLKKNPQHLSKLKRQLTHLNVHPKELNVEQ